MSAHILHHRVQAVYLDFDTNLPTSMGTFTMRPVTREPVPVRVMLANRCEIPNSWLLMFPIILPTARRGRPAREQRHRQNDFNSAMYQQLSVGWSSRKYSSLNFFLYKPYNNKIYVNVPFHLSQQFEPDAWPKVKLRFKYLQEFHPRFHYTVILDLI